MRKKICKRNGFTLVELLIVLVIASIIFAFAMDKNFLNTIKINIFYNENQDLRSGVATTTDYVTNTLKNSTSIFFVGSNVYDFENHTHDFEDYIQKFDKGYNYIGYKKDDKGNRYLVDVRYDKGQNKFLWFPIVAKDKGDLLKGRDINYDIEFYKDDIKYREKMEKKLVKFSVTGILTEHSPESEDNDNNKYTVEKEIYCENSNQVLESPIMPKKFGDSRDFTAIAYKDVNIVGKLETKGGNIGIVFIGDNSGSMRSTLENRPIAYYNSNYYSLPAGGYMGNYGGWLRYSSQLLVTEDELKRKYPSRKYALGEKLNNVFLPDLHKIAQENDVNVYTYIYNFSNEPLYTTMSRSGNYIFNLSDIGDIDPSEDSMEELKTGYGPYNLKYTSKYEEALKHVKGKCEFNIINDELYQYISRYGSYRGHFYRYIKGAATNIGGALLQGFDILNQMKEKGIEHRFLILLTDGIPQGWYCCILQDPRTGRTMKVPVLDRRYYPYKRFDGDKNQSLNYIKEVCDANNKSDTFERAYLIGFSAIDRDKERQEEIKGYLDNNGNGNVDLSDASDPDSLEAVFKNITKEIGSVASDFDGPKATK